MTNEKLVGNDIDYSIVARYIPDVMNVLYDKECFDSVSFEEIRVAFRVKQMQSKSWMMRKIDSLDLVDKNSKVLVIGSWLGFTSYCLYKMGFQHITETDPDTRLEKFANRLNRRNKHFVHLSKDINDVDVSKFDLIINTSCEHIADNSWYDRIVTGTVMVLHSNNLEGYDHVNICKDVDEMKTKYPMQMLYSGELYLEQYSRFMLVGVRHT